MTIVRKRTKKLVNRHRDLIQFAQDNKFIVNFSFNGEKRIAIKSEQFAKEIHLFTKFDLSGFRVVYLDEYAKQKSSGVKPHLI